MTQAKSAGYRPAILTYRRKFSRQDIDCVLDPRSLFGLIPDKHSALHGACDKPSFRALPPDEKRAFRTQMLPRFDTGQYGKGPSSGLIEGLNAEDPASKSGIPLTPQDYFFPRKGSPKPLDEEFSAEPGNAPTKEERAFTLWREMVQWARARSPDQVYGFIPEDTFRSKRRGVLPDLEIVYAQASGLAARLQLSVRSSRRTSSVT